MDECAIMNISRKCAVNSLLKEGVLKNEKNGSALIDHHIIMFFCCY
jgi:hypothetical protein